MSVALSRIVGHLDEVLEVERFRDYGPNGLQVEGKATVERVVTGVSATLGLFDAAADLGADLIVVHHGLIWGPGLGRVTGSVARRLRALMAREISLAAYHLPLDAHRTLGNNVGLADALGLERESWRWFGDVRGHALGLSGRFAEPLSRVKAVERIAKSVLDGAEPNFVLPHGPSEVRTVGLCTGAASDLLEDAAAAGCDLFITGELAERSAGLAAELGVTLVGAGHHCTETFGVASIARHLSKQFSGIETQFIDIPSPL